MLQKTSWPPDYSAEEYRRYGLLLDLQRRSKAELNAIKAEYVSDPVMFIEDWCETFDPRNAGTGKLTRMPFKLFPKQVELVEFLHACLMGEANGLIEKSRDMGATWVCVSFSVWAFLFLDGATIGWGSRKAAQVDKLGDMSSIFEKLRFQIMSVPSLLYPDGFDPAEHMNQMKIYAPSGNSITGEAGDDVGRGGRTRIYFKDESAHYEHPEMIEAALGDNTRVQIDISSVNGLGNVFHRRRDAGFEWSAGTPVVHGKTNVFVMDWSDHPAKTQAWYDARYNSAMDEGMLHIFHQEVDRDYAASVEGVIIPAEWVVSAIDAHEKLDIDTGRGWYAGLDVADEGGDRNALVTRRGVLMVSADEWGAPDTGHTTRKAIELLTGTVPQNSNGRHPVRVMYDSIGVGAGVKSESNRLEEANTLPPGIKFYSWHAGAKVLDPDKRVEDTLDGEMPINKDFFMNLKAQAWWALRRRFEKTHQAVVHGTKFPTDDLISIPSTLPKLRTIQKELSQPTSKKSATMKLMIDKKPEGTRSPNIADSIVMAFFPVEEMTYDSTLDWV